MTAVEQRKPLEPDNGALEETVVEGDVVEKKKSTHQIVQRTVTWAAPLPPPDVLKGYKDLQPDFPERFLKLTEDEADHRRKMNRWSLILDAVEVVLGQVLAFIVSLAFLGASVYLGVKGHEWLAGIISSGTIIALVTVFIRGRSAGEEEFDDDDEE